MKLVGCGLVCGLCCALFLNLAHAGDPSAEGAVSPDAIVEKIRQGDASSVPTLRLWLGKESDVATVREATPKLALALMGLGAFGDTNSARLVAFLYKEAPFRSKLRQMAGDTLASIGARETLEELKAVVWDQQQEFPTRCKAAASLVRLDNDLGRDFLLLQYDLYRLERKTVHAWNMDPVRKTLERLDDAKLVGALEQRVESEPVNTTMRNNITTLIDRMKLCAEPVAKLKAIAANPSWAEGNNNDRRYSAIAMLGQKAGPDCIPFLEALKPWEGIDPNPNSIQQKYVKEFAQEAVVAIRQRCWRQAGG